MTQKDKIEEVVSLFDDIETLEEGVKDLSFVQDCHTPQCSTELIQGTINFRSFQKSTMHG